MPAKYLIMNITLFQASSNQMEPVLTWLCIYNTIYHKEYSVIGDLYMFLCYLVCPMFLDWICWTKGNEQFFLFDFEQHSQYFDSIKLSKLLSLYDLFDQMSFLWIEVEVIFVASCNLHRQSIFVHELLWQYIELCNGSDASITC